MDFKILDVAIITRSRLQTSEQLIPPRQWTFPERLRKLETYFHVVSGFGRSFLTLEIASHHQSHQNQWKSRISKDFDEIHGFQDTRCSDHHEITTSDYWIVDSAPEMDFPKRLRTCEAYFHVLSGFGRSFLTFEIASHHQTHQNQWKSRISKDFDEIHGFQDTQYSVWDARSGPFPLELGSISHYEWEGNIFTRCTFWVYSPWLFHRSAVCEMGVGTHRDVREHRRLAQLQLAVSGGLVLLKVARWSAIGESARRRKYGRMGWTGALLSTS